MTETLPQSVTLQLRATRAIPRQLQVNLSPGRRLYVRAYAPQGHMSLASADVWIADAMLSFGKNGVFLHVGCALFGLTDLEGTEVENALAPHGLNVRREEGQ